jgi:hypothetical protein
MSWRLPPPIWIASRRKTAALATVLQFGAVAWRLAKWCVGAGVMLPVLRRLTTGMAWGWSAAAWLAAGAWLLFLWERYGLAEAAFAARRWPRWMASVALALAAGAGTLAVAHLAAPLALAMLGVGA